MLNLTSTPPNYTYAMQQPELAGAKIVYVPQNANSLVALNNGNLYQISLGSNGVATDALLSTGVVDFNIENNGYIYYVQKLSGKYELERMLINGSNKSVIASTIDPSASYTFAYSAQKDIIAVLANDTKTLTAYYSVNGQPITLPLSNNAAKALWSKDGNYLVYSTKMRPRFIIGKR